MSKKIRNAEEYTAMMDGLVTGLRNRANEATLARQKLTTTWASIIVAVSAIVLLTLFVVEGGSRFAGKGLFW